MSNLRKKALESAYSHLPVNVESDFKKPSDIFSINAFGKKKMQEYLSPKAYEIVMKVIEEGAKLDLTTANEVASAMKTWALSRGATHYTHWFQPLRGATAEKHSSFISQKDDASIIESFEGKELIQQEPDASSFPSGGIRNTYEARGYSVWDPTSSSFIIDNTLCIPTIYISFTGEALDFKIPLLKSVNLLDKAATDICQYFDKNVTRVIATLGWEQEYFLADESLYNARPDLVMAGRTLYGHESAKGQQLEDHYFASIPERVGAFMKEVEIEAWKLGIPINTIHNEVAPNQYEITPIFEELNLSNDHNIIVMDLMHRTARKHNFMALLHEKPYGGINGSGKHNNWSMQTNTGKNLLSPGKTPHTNFQFLTFLFCIIKAVCDHADLLRASIATSGNEHRLGANEAPPAIISVFIGSHLTKVINEIETKVKSGKMTEDEKHQIKLEIGKIPEIIFDNSDRNRTSPFAFTGNKFEFRALGSSANCASSMIILSTIVAEQLIEFKAEADKLIAAGTDKEEAILKILRSYIVSSKKILFEGNNYSEEWVAEAAKRGLPNIKDVPEALKANVAEKNIKFLSKHNILSEREIHSRFHVELENYYKILQIESRTLGNLAMNHIIPAAINYQNVLMKNVHGLKECSALSAELLVNNENIDKQMKHLLQTISQISEHINIIQSKVKEMTETRKKANKIEDVYEHAEVYCKKVKPFFEEIRLSVDKLEFMVDDELWPLPKYRELLFIR